MSITGGITVGNLITALSILLSAAALTYSWHKDRQLRRTEYADRIRHAAGVITANLERWQSLVQQFFNEVQPFLLDVERAAAEQQEIAPARFALLRGLYEQRAVVGQRISAEQLGTAYIDLYGYDPRIHGLYLSAVSQMQQIDEQSFVQLCTLAWRDIAPPPATAHRPPAKELPDALRRACAEIATNHEHASDRVIAAFRAEMVKLIVADDQHLLTRTVPLAAALPPLPVG